MTLRTTINAHESTYDLLSYISNAYGVSFAHVIHLLIHLLSVHQNHFFRDRVTTQYQCFDVGVSFIVHVRLSENDLDFAKDLRRFYRASFSLLIAEALIYLYDELISALKDLDNYPGSCHVKVYFEEKGTVYWKHIWGMPKEEEIQLPQRE